MTKIANVGQTVEPVDSMHPHPRNPNQGDVGSISESIEAHGFYGQVIAQQSSRTILAGEHRWRAAKATGMGEIPVTWVDVDDDQALRIVLVDNRSAELAYRDPQALVDLLQELAQTPLALAGTGYDGDGLDELLADLAKVDEPLDIEPAADESGRLTASWGVVVNCKNEKEQRQLLERFAADGLDCRALTG